MTEVGGRVHPNEELARREIALINSGQDEAVKELYADGFVLHYPGRSPLAGTYYDVDTFLTKLTHLFEGGVVTRHLHDALGSDEHAVQLLEVTAQAKGMSHSWRATIVMHVRDGRFTEAWFHIDDQYALDEFLRSLE